MLSTTASRIGFSGNGATTAFAFPYEYRASADLQVVVVSSANVATLKALGTHYTVSGIADSHGGYSSATVTMATAPTSGETLVIYRKPALVQEADIESESEPLYALNNALDLAYYSLQHLENDKLGLPIGVGPNFSPTLPDLPEADGEIYYLGPSGNRSSLAWLTGLDGDISVAANLIDVVTAGSTNEALGELNGVLEVSTKAALSALVAGIVDAVHVRDRATVGDGGGGLFVWRSGDQSASVTIDTLGGIWVAPNSDTDGSSGAWQRSYDGYVDPRWFGAIFYSGAVGSFDSEPAITAALEWGHVELPAGTANQGAELFIEGRILCGQGQDITVLRPLTDTFNAYSAGEDSVVLDITFDGNNVAATHAGGIYDSDSTNSFADRVKFVNWGEHGLAVTNGASDLAFGAVLSSNNGSRGVIIDPHSHDVSFDAIIARDNVNADILIGHDAHHISIGRALTGGTANSSIWIHNAAYECSIGECIIDAPASGHENNSALLIGWGAVRNHIGRVVVNGWRRAVQLKGAAVDATYTNSDTAYNVIEDLHATLDGGSNAAAVYLDANGGYFAKHNRIRISYIKNATYGVWDTNGTNTGNDIDASAANFDTVTTPYSLSALGDNRGTYRDKTTGYLGFDCWDPTQAFQFRKLVVGQARVASENPSSAASTNKGAGFQAYSRSTASALKSLGYIDWVPDDNDCAAAHIEGYVESGSANVLAFKFMADKDFEPQGDVTMLTGKRVDYQNSQSTVGVAGGASALPATPSGYIPIKVAGNAFVLPYYAAS